MKASDTAIGYGATTGGTLLGTKVSPASTATLANSTSEALAFDITVPNLVSGLRYRIAALVHVSSSVASNFVTLRIRSTNLTSGTLLGEALVIGPAGGYGALWAASVAGVYDAPSNEASRTFGLFVMGGSGNAQVGHTAGMRLVMDVHQVPVLS